MLSVTPLGISYNVLSMRHSSPPYKANRRFAVGWNVGERKPHQAKRLRFFEPRRGE